MIGKLLVHSDDRDQAIQRMARALDEFKVAPIHTTIALHRELMDDPGFVKGGVDIHYLERLLKK